MGDKHMRATYWAGVGSPRIYLTRHRIGAIWLIVAALLVRAAVPPGFMPVFSKSAVVMQLCSGFGPEPMNMTMPGMSHHGNMDHPGKDPTPCGFDGHAAPSLTTVDPILLVLTIALIVSTLSRMPVSWPARWVSFLRPPLRGPPAIR